MYSVIVYKGWRLWTFSLIQYLQLIMLKCRECSLESVHTEIISVYLYNKNLDICHISYCVCP